MPQPLWEAYLTTLAVEPSWFISGNIQRPNSPNVYWDAEYES